ncbi:MAG TPA: DJ-1/PfpI family protein [Longimicrobium sp.]|nr:DJ-1/PfpI family protein [Longimicrobium sp.]
MTERPRDLVIGIALYAGMDPLDVVGPYEVFSEMAQGVAPRRRVSVYLLGETHAPVTTRFGITLFPQRAFHEVDELDVLWVPGGAIESLEVLMKGGVYLDALKRWSRDAQVVCSVCEGALLLAAAGLLDGCRATTHWAFYRCLEAFPKVEVVGPGADGSYPRYVLHPARPARGERGVRLTGGGISSGLDEALRLVKLLFGKKTAEEVQVNIQYFPRPPVKGTLPPPPDCPMPPRKPRGS